MEDRDSEGRCYYCGSGSEGHYSDCDGKTIHGVSVGTGCTICGLFPVDHCDPAVDHKYTEVPTDGERGESGPCDHPECGFEEPCCPDCGRLGMKADNGVKKLTGHPLTASAGIPRIPSLHRGASDGAPAQADQPPRCVVCLELNCKKDHDQPEQPEERKEIEMLDMPESPDCEPEHPEDGVTIPDPPDSIVAQCRGLAGNLGRGFNEQQAKGALLRAADCINRLLARVRDTEARRRIERELKEQAEERVRELEQSHDYLDAANQIQTLRTQVERLKEERAAALDVKTKEGLTCSEWVLRTGLAEKEVERLRGELEQEAQTIIRMIEREERLEGHLIDYGIHSPSCASAAKKPCDCGWDEIRKALEEKS